MGNIESQRTYLIQRIKEVDSFNFEELALQVFDYQRSFCPVYRSFLEVLGKINWDPTEIDDIPLLPVSAFKHNLIKTGDFEAEVIFLSSATSGHIPSRHFVRSEKWYRDIARKCFQANYGSISKYAFLALLPSYLERSGSSLINMTKAFIQESDYEGSGFFLDNFDALYQELEKVKKLGVPTIFIGVSYALLDFSEHYPMDLGDIIVMETGGMKGRKKEIPRSILHSILCNRLKVSHIHSEYGMTELLSQAYSPGLGIFTEGNTIKMTVKQITDPLTAEITGRSGLLGIIDLANIDSCSFLLTDDLGRKLNETQFEVLGRSDHSEIRGCNLMVSDL